MTSPTLTAMLHHSVAAKYPELNVSGLPKVDLLVEVKDAHGWAAVVALGAEVQTLGWHPVVQALTASAEPAAVIERWIRLERFGHSRNRTELVGLDLSNHDSTLTLRHVAIDGGQIVDVNDLFIWGLIIALLESAGTAEIRAELVQKHGEGFVIYDDGLVSAPAQLPRSTDMLLLRASLPGTSAIESNAREVNGEAPPTQARLSDLIQADLLGTWTVAAAARTLGVSGRSLQRALREEGTTFSEVVQRTRVQRAHTLITDSALSLTEIAFCVGFSDQAHFARVFRRYSDVPPSALRGIWVDDRSK